MKNFIAICGVVILMFSCQIQNYDNKSTVSSDSKITTDEQTRLDSLKPQTDNIILEVFGDKDALSEGKQLDLKKLNIFKSRMESLLKNEFGDDYKKFIVEKKQQIPIDQVSIQNKSAKTINVSQKNSILAGIIDSGSVSLASWMYKYQANYGGYYDWIEATYCISLSVTANTLSYGAISTNYITQYFGEWRRLYYYYNNSWVDSANTFPVEYQSLQLSD